MDTSLIQQSARISCEHMSALAQKERDFNHFNFVTRMTNTESTVPVSYELSGAEHRILKGYIIDKKNCVYKRPQYNSGEWEKQFESPILSDREIFNIQSKKKSVAQSTV